MRARGDRPGWRRLRTLSGAARAHVRGRPGLGEAKVPWPLLPALLGGPHRGRAQLCSSARSAWLAAGIGGDSASADHRREGRRAARAAACLEMERNMQRPSPLTGYTCQQRARIPSSHREEQQRRDIVLSVTEFGSLVVHPKLHACDLQANSFDVMGSRSEYDGKITFRTVVDPARLRNPPCACTYQVRTKLKRQTITKGTSPPPLVLEVALHPGLLLRTLRAVSHFESAGERTRRFFEYSANIEIRYLSYRCSLIT